MIDQAIARESVPQVHTRAKSCMSHGTTPKYSQPSGLTCSTVPSPCRHHIYLASSSRRISKGLFERRADPRFDFDDNAKIAQYQIALIAVAVSLFLVNSCGNRCPIAMVTRLNAEAAITAWTRPRNLARSRTQTIATRSHFEPHKPNNQNLRRSEEFRSKP
jgi:hypothetical protein